MNPREPQFKLKDGIQYLSEGIYKLHRPLHEYVPPNSKIYVKYCRFYIYKGSGYPNVIQLDKFHPESVFEKCALHVGNSVWREYAKGEVLKELDSIKAQLAQKSDEEPDNLAEAWKANMNGY